MFEKYLTEFIDAIYIQFLLAGFGRILLILLFWWIATRVARRLLSMLEKRLLKREETNIEPATEKQKRVATLVMLVRQGTFILITVTTLLLGLKQLGIDIAPILASAGVVGLAIGFGAQNLVRDIISGFFLILENQVRVGDVANINGTGGLVEEVNFRTLILRDLSGTMHVFPNGEIKTIANLTSQWSAYVFDIGVAYKEDPNHVIQVMEEEGKKMR
jgi:small conductance mechanosensitive channel